MYIELCIELYGRDTPRTAKRISNPGCYATAVSSLLAPVLPYIAPGSMLTDFGVCGYSNAGTVTGPNDEAGRPTTLAKATAESLRGGLKSYALTNHINEREARRHLSTLLPSGAPPLKVAFTPAVAPWFSGVLALAFLHMMLDRSLNQQSPVTTARRVTEKVMKRTGHAEKCRESTDSFGDIGLGRLQEMC
jgi:N-acetyl-gamma-glutamylphosphate reductase